MNLRWKWYTNYKLKKKSIKKSEIEKVGKNRELRRNHKTKQRNITLV